MEVNFIVLTNAATGGPVMIRSSEILSVLTDDQGITRIYTPNLGYYLVKESVEIVADILSKLFGTFVINKGLFTALKEGAADA